MFYSVNVKLTTQNEVEFLKNKLKRYLEYFLLYSKVSSFLLNHSHFYINPHINSEQTIQKVVRLFLRVRICEQKHFKPKKGAIMKIYAFFEELRKTRRTLPFQIVISSKSDS